MADKPLILIVEDDADLALSLQNEFAAEGLASAAFASAESFLEAASIDHASCLLLDVRLPKMSGMELQEVLRLQHVPLPIIVMSGEASVSDTIRAFENGAFRVFQKPVDSSQLMEAVRKAIVAGSELREAQARDCQHLAALTNREREVLELLIQDKSTRQIARELSISPSTVEKHRAKILAKVGVNSVVGLANFCLSNQLSFMPAPHFRFSTANGPVNRPPASVPQSTTESVRIAAGRIV